MSVSKVVANQPLLFLRLHATPSRPSIQLRSLLLYSCARVTLSPLLSPLLFLDRSELNPAQFISSMATYPCQIPSLLAIHPNLAPLAAVSPEITQTEANSALLRPAAVAEARIVVDVLRSSRGVYVGSYVPAFFDAVSEHNPNAPVTLAALNDAHTRKTVLESIHGADTFMGGLQNALAIAIAPVVNNAIAGIPAAINAAVNAAVGPAVNAALGPAANVALVPAVNAALPAAVNAAIPAALNAALAPTTTALELLTAQVHSFMARSHNRDADHNNIPFQGIRKTVGGSGLALAAGLVPAAGGVALPQASNNNINAVCPLIVAPTGAVILNFTHFHILTLIEFYNEHMSIVPTDSVAERRAKVLFWMRWHN
ncbi:hypothetical protein DFH08DRAFT_87708 [Mycena albidolilacea]|uniref:Uncharacterized protein n=1 Tax=Mycena albidolilacea TaxID=1033008 RepID=A0AAD7A9P7_9AGAR|nr:hypothetical protein DFH08DRAFT_87708 [Mycena albidolilacea]